MIIGVNMRYRTAIFDAVTKRCLKQSPWHKNLVMDQGLNALAQSTNQCQPASAHVNCSVGSGTNPNSIASGAVTFTQAGTTVTASAGFFASNMVGGILKYGTGAGGTEVYITGFTSSTIVTVATSLSVVVPTVGTVWMVQQTGLQTFLFNQDSYQTSGGSNSTTFSGNQITHQRTFVFNQRGTPYVVNEIGWSAATGNNVNGRAVLPSSDSIGTTNFYVVTIAITYTYSPGSPTAVINVGTGINTSGNAMIEWFNILKVAANGGFSGGGVLDNSVNGGVVAGISFITAIYSQNSSINSTTPPTYTVGYSMFPIKFVYVGGSVGQMRITFSGSFTTAGETLFGIGIADNSQLTHPAFDVKLTTPFTLPVGTFNPSGAWTATYGRTLTN
jgi:hypothetical protein